MEGIAVVDLCATDCCLDVVGENVRENVGQVCGRRGRRC